jgi:hypothetical protein
MDGQAVPVVSYGRISADTAGDEHDLAEQHKDNRETAARMGWTVVHEITDNDRSAGTGSDGLERHATATLRATLGAWSGSWWLRQCGIRLASMWAYTTNAIQPVKVET